MKPTARIQTKKLTLPWHCPSTRTYFIIPVILKKLKLISFEFSNAELERSKLISFEFSNAASKTETNRDNINLETDNPDLINHPDNAEKMEMD